MALQRRTLIKSAGAGLALGTAGGALASPAMNAPRLKHYVLIHGTWHGGWCWWDVALRLMRKGHRVTTPTLTGCGERSHLIGPEVGLQTHIDDVLQTLRYDRKGRYDEDLILVGHSFSGITITGVADALRDRIKHLVFFDALIPTAERRAAVMRDPETGEYPEWWLKRAAKFEDGYKMSFWEEYDLRMLVPKDDARSRALLKRYLTWHPAKQWTDELQLNNGGWEGLKRTCIHAVGQTYRRSSEAMVGPGREPGWNFVELDVARDGFLTDPGRVAEAFDALS